MPAKFGRSYSLLVGTSDPLAPITIKPPFTMEFDIVRDYYASANHANIRVYNLSEKNRNLVRKDVMNLGSFRPINLQAGYGKNLPVILKGNITQAFSEREGQNFITTISAFDAGFAFANAQTDANFIAGTPIKTVITQIMKGLGQFDVLMGAVGDFQGTIPRSNSYSGPTAQILKDLTGGAFFIDNGVAHALQDGEVLDGQTLLISKDSGLLGTPRLEQTRVIVDILFEPAVKINQLCLLDSTVGAVGSRNAPAFNTTYKVAGVHHHGVISDAIAGEARTTLTLVSGKFNPVRSAT